jgi:hypothetical protein
METWAWFFGWVGLAALILTIPLNVAANVLTPIIRDWWASTSKTRGFKRHRQISQQMFILKSGTEFNSLSRFMSLLLRCCISGVGLLLCIIVLESTDQAFLTTGNIPEAQSERLIYRAGMASLGFMAFFSAFVINSYYAVGQAKLISTRYRRRYLAKLRLKRYRLKKRLGLVDNSARAPICKPDSSI